MAFYRTDVTFIYKPDTVPTIYEILPKENGLIGTLTVPDPLKSAVKSHNNEFGSRVYPYPQVPHYNNVVQTAQATRLHTIYYYY